ncbi:hypothetical protein DSO57_1005017 [Entomophthora muscae]|uniref:Uncharacterized protein n=1 Tax=Entomophthora muscae TaxID=34485 RepID=A0ACC2TJA4_9FUNG|nr:hypothetical protein DSO57_1005017 [Entomophthora muscae]
MPERPKRSRSLISYAEDVKESYFSDDSDEAFVPNKNPTKKKLKNDVKPSRVTKLNKNKSISSQEDIQIISLPSSPIQENNSLEVPSIDPLKPSNESIIEESDFFSGSDLTDIESDSEKYAKISRKLMVTETASQLAPFSESYEIHSQENDEVNVLDEASSGEEKPDPVKTLKLTEKSQDSTLENSPLHPSPSKINAKSFIPKQAFSQSPIPSTKEIHLIPKRSVSSIQSAPSHHRSKIATKDENLKSTITSSIISKPKPSSGTTSNVVASSKPRMRLPGTGLFYSSKLPSLHPKKDR